MNIILNGNAHQTEPDTTITSLLASLGLADKPVIVELNKRALFPRQYDDSVLQSDDSVEVITIAAGG